MKQGCHLPNFGFETPTIGSGSNEPITSNGGLGEGRLGNKLVNDESARIKLLILKKAPNKKNLTQSDTTLALMPSKDGVSNNSMKVPKSGVTN